MTEIRATSEPRRRRFQFSLRTLLIGVALLSLLSTISVNVAREEARANERKSFRRDHPQFGFVPTGDPGVSVPDPPEVSWIRRAFGDQAIKLIVTGEPQKYFLSGDRLPGEIQKAKELFPEAQVVEFVVF
jgi:hypothetical protein